VKVLFIPGFILLRPNEALALINKRKRNAAVSIDDLESYFASSHEGSIWLTENEAQLKLQMQFCNS